MNQPRHRRFGFAPSLGLGLGLAVMGSGCSSAGPLTMGSGGMTAGAGGTAGGAASSGGGGAGQDGGGRNGGSGVGGWTGAGGGTIPSTINLTSPVLMEGGMFSANTTCADPGMGSPQLDWTAGPSGTMSYAVTLTDLTNGYIYWVI
jgi:hypothetical protein